MLLKWCSFHWAAKPRTLPSAIPSFFTCYFIIFCTLFFRKGEKEASWFWCGIIHTLSSWFLCRGEAEVPGWDISAVTERRILPIWLLALLWFHYLPKYPIYETVIRWLLTDWCPGFELNQDSCRWNRPANVSEVLKCLCDLLHLGQSLVLGTVELHVLD